MSQVSILSVRVYQILNEVPVCLYSLNNKSVINTYLPMFVEINQVSEILRRFWQNLFEPRIHFEHFVESRDISRPFVAKEFW